MAGRLLFVILIYSFHKIQTQDLLPPTLKVNSPEIRETDSVTLHCQTPHSVSVSQCYFYTLSGGTRVFPCLKTLTGTELLQMSQQSSPAEVQVKCYFTVKYEGSNSPSPHSDPSFITVHSQKPQMSVHRDPGEYILFFCTLPGSADHGARCNLYFGENNHPVQTATIWKNRVSKNRLICQFTFTIEDFLRSLHLLKRHDVSCDYSLGSETNSLSPRSDGYSLTDIVEKERSKISAFTTPPGLTVGSRNTPSFISSSIKPVKPTQGQNPYTSSTQDIFSPVTQVTPSSETWKLVIVAASFGGVIVLGLAFIFTKRTTDASGYMGKLSSGEYLPSGYDETYSIVTYERSNIE